MAGYFLKDRVTNKMEHQWSIIQEIEGGKHKFKVIGPDDEDDYYTNQNTIARFDIFPYADPAGYYLIQIEDTYRAPITYKALAFFCDVFQKEVIEAIGDKVAIYIPDVQGFGTFYIRADNGLTHFTAKLRLKLLCRG